MSVRLCSACLLGVSCRYDGNSKPNDRVLALAKLCSAKEAILKQRSPSCGCRQIYDGTFSGKVVKGDGVTTVLLKKNKIKVISEEDL